MPDLTPEIVDQVHALCTEGAEEAAGAFGRALGAQIALSVGQAGTLDLEELPEGLDGAGLAVVLTVGASGAVVLLPESSGLLPEWCAEPDPTGQSKLSTLAQELGRIVLPEQFVPQEGKAARVENLAEALRRGEVSDGACVVPLELSAGEKQGVARVIWPVGEPAAVLESAAEPEPSPASQAAPDPQPAPGHRKARLKELPSYGRSLLRIKVPVVVTLAEKRQPLRQIVELGSGSIIQFEKSCDEMLEMSVGGHRIASGEAVKVGDKFGLRITSMILPDERFGPVRPQ